MSNSENCIELDNLCMRFVHHKCSPMANVTKRHFLCTLVPYRWKCFLKYKLLGLKVQESIYSFMANTSKGFLITLSWQRNISVTSKHFSTMF